MKKVSRKIDLSGWHLDAFDGMDKIIKKATSEALQLAFESKHSYISFFSRNRGRKPPDDPLTMCLEVGLERMEGEEKPTFEIHLREGLDFYLESCKEDGIYYLRLERLMHALRALADEIETTLMKSTE